MAAADHDPAALDALATLGGAAFVRQVLQAMRTVLEALPRELADGYAAHDAPRVQRAAHSVLSVSAYVGETALRDAAVAIERAVRSDAWASLPALLSAFDAARVQALPRLTAALARFADE